MARHRSESVAIVSAGVNVTYGQLTSMVRTAADQLTSSQRRLVLLGGGNHLEALVWYLAALTADQPVILIPGDHLDHADDIIERYQPDVVILPDEHGSWTLQEQRAGSIHDLHPELSLMLSTSGSTGSPKLVRLSARNLDANAASIAEYLALTEADRAITTLPMHYSYGLSVINSHLLVGGSLVLTEDSVIDSSFWDLVDLHEPTSMAGVPHTFSLLERTDFSRRDLPFRYLTQAGGRLAPEKVRSFAALCRERGMEFFVMYGQTEATARMAYLPPELAESQPSAVGRAIPGGAFTIEPYADHDASDGTGELVYRGPNVMMGYAETGADLARGAELDELRTGDLARFTDDGLVEVVGRTARFAKVFGLRIDLARVESHLEGCGVSAAAVSMDDALGILVATPDRGDLARASIVELTGLPAHVIRVAEIGELPRLRTGKVDYAAAAEVVLEQCMQVAATEALDVEVLARIYGEVLDEEDVQATDTFVGLGGDSLSFVELSIRLERALHCLPDDWPTMSIAELVGYAESHTTTAARPVRGWRRWLQGRSFETIAVARAAGIFLVVCGHIVSEHVRGGGHILIFVSGFAFARFQLTATGWPRSRKLLATVRRIVWPTLPVLCLVQLLFGGYDWRNALFVMTIAEPNRPWGQHYQFWYLEFMVQILVVLAAVLAIPSVSRLERRWPFWFPLGVVILGFIPRFGFIPGFHPPTPEVQPINAVWVFALGWAAARCTSNRQRLLVSMLLLIGVINMFPAAYNDHPREAVILLGALGVVWLPTLRLPAAAAPLVMIAASASLYIYVTHYAVFELMSKVVDIHSRPDRVLIGVVAMAVGVAYWWLWTRVSSWLALRWQARRARLRARAAADDHS